MIIKELILLSFGTFNKKKISLEDGMNVIHANNQTEKTTVHKFIESMFLGPKKSPDYYGILRYQHNNNIYRVERNLIKEENELKIFNEQTGERLKNAFEQSNGTRFKDPSSIHLNLNRVMFSNTMNIEELEQGNNEVESQVNSSLINISESLDRDLSVDNVIGKLKQEIDKIETEKKTKYSPYNDIVSRIEILEHEKEKSYTSLVKTNEYTMKLNKAREKLNQMIDDREELRQEIKKHEEYERYNMFREINTIECEMKSLEGKLETSLDYKPIPTQQYNDILRIAEKIKISKQQVQAITEKEKVLRTDIDAITKELETLSKLDLNDQIDFDLYECESKEEELHKLKDSRGQFSDSTQKDNLSNISKDIGNIKNKRVLVLCVTPLSATLVVSNIGFLAVPVILIIIAFIFLIKEKALKKKRTILEQLIEKTIYSERDLDSTIENLEKEKHEILTRQGVADVKQLREKKLSFEREKRLNYEKQSYIKQEKDLTKEKDKLTIYYQDLKLDLEYLLENNNFRDINHLNDMVEKGDRDNKLLAMLASKRLILENLKSKLNLEKLNQEFEGLELKAEHIKEMKKQDIDKIKQKYENKCENISAKKAEIKEIDSKIENLQRNARNLVSIQEDINRGELEKRKYDEDLKALNISKDTLESVSKNIHKEFSPKLNKLITDIIGSITSKKHANLKSEKKLSIKAINNKGNLVEISCLNSETVEQIYFNSRDKKLPLILGDSFEKYEDEKLESILKLLYKESLKRQIIILTFRDREMKILDKLRLNYKMIKL